MKAPHPPLSAECLDFLAGFVTPDRMAKIDRVLADRTDRVRVVLEDIFQSHNASAAMRSCECFGVQNLHIIENRYTYTPNREVSMGANKWVTLHRHRSPETDNTTVALQQLKAQGFRIVATALAEDTIPLAELPVDEPLALCFGTEEDGLSETALGLADYKVQIPMFGFTQSFNISVTVALCLHDVGHRVRQQCPDWRLSPEVRHALRTEWICKTLKNPEALIRRFEAER